MECWLVGCQTKEAHGHWVVDRGCAECLAYALTSPELVGQPTPPRPWHHTLCGKHSNEPMMSAADCPACSGVVDVIVAVAEADAQAVVAQMPTGKRVKRPRPTGKVRVKKATKRGK